MALSFLRTRKRYHKGIITMNKGMRRLLPILSMVAFLLLLAAPAFAAEDHTCDHNGDTVESLHHCVMHALEMEHINNPGVANSLMAKLDAAQAALDRGQTGVAINLLQAFINQVNAQAGIHIDAEHAGHLVAHAEHVILTLAG